MSAPPRPGSFQLTVSVAAAGDGTVTSSPQGINCPTACAATFAANATVQLTATPAQNDFFANWSGACSGTGACAVTMTTDQTVSAAFNPGEQLTVTMSGSGSGTVTSNPAGINCPTACSATFPQNTQVTLTETPGSNAVFSSWGGACTGAASCDVTLSTADSVTADFSSSTGGDGGGPATLIYVSSNTSGSSGSSDVIEGFTADASGQLTSISGSPFAFNVADLVGKGNYLYGTDGTNIFTFAIAADGSLTQAGSVNAQQYNNPNNCGGPEFLFLDRGGSTLYDLDFFRDCSNNAYQSFGIDASTGSLKYLGMTSASSPIFETGLSFLGNNAFAYAASCYNLLQEVFSFRHNDDGTLTLATNLASATPLPTAPDGQTYCPWLAAADNGNHFAVSMTPMDTSTFQPVGPPELAVYTADSSGGESTASTDQNMPQVATGAINDMEMSVDGKFLAVGGTGLQVFQFNGANPITQLTDLLMNDAIDQVAWDRTDHLYAISNSSGQLFVFRVTASGVTQAPGSPYTITRPVNVAVVSQ